MAILNQFQHQIPSSSTSAIENNKTIIQVQNRNHLNSAFGEEQDFIPLSYFEFSKNHNHHCQSMELPNKDYHNNNNIYRNSLSQFTTTTSGRSSLSDLNSIFSDQVIPQQQPYYSQQNYLNNMNHKHNISISSEQSAIETLPQHNRKASITESDCNVSPVLQNDPFELDQSLWSASVPSSSTSAKIITSPSYQYRSTDLGNSTTSPTFSTGSNNRQASINDFSLNSLQNQFTDASSTSRRASYLSDTIWNNNDQLPHTPQQQQQHSRHSSFTQTDFTYPKPNELVSPGWNQFNGPRPAQQQQQPVPPPPQAAQFRNLYPTMNNDLAAAAQRRHSYAAAISEPQWPNEMEGGYFNFPPQSAGQPPQQAMFGMRHIQRLSADFSELGLNSDFNNNNNNNNNTPQITDDDNQPHESSELLRNAYKSVDYYFTNDEHHRVHITDANAADDALSKKGAQLPRFPGNTIPGAKLVLIGFKAGRVDVFYLPEKSNLILTIGDLVYVEADRGQDLGKVVRLDVSIDEARLLKLRQHQEQQLALVDNEQLVSSGFLPPINSQQQQQQQQPQPIPSLHFPKPVIRFADPQQVAQVPNKQADEEKARRICALKVRTHGLVMQVVDLEYQWDRRKLTFYYAANQRIDFRELVKELFRIYKTRIWMCAVSGGLNAVQQQQQQLGNGNENNDIQFNSSLFNGPYNEYLKSSSTQQSASNDGK